MNRPLVDQEQNLESEDYDEHIYINTPTIKNFKWNYQLDTLSPKNLETPRSVIVEGNKSAYNFSNEFTQSYLLTQSQIQTNDRKRSYEETRIKTCPKEDLKSLNEMENVHLKVIESDKVDKLQVKINATPTEEICQCCANKYTILKKIVLKILNKTFSVKDFFLRWLIYYHKEKAKEYKEKFVQHLREHFLSASYSNLAEINEIRIQSFGRTKSLQFIPKSEIRIETTPKAKYREYVKNARISIEKLGFKKKSVLIKSNENIFSIIPNSNPFKRSKDIGICNEIQVEEYGEDKIRKTQEVQTDNIPVDFKFGIDFKDKIINTSKFFKGLEIVNEINHESIPKILKKIIITNHNIHYERGFNIFKKEPIISNEINIEFYKYDRRPILEISNEAQINFKKRRGSQNILSKINEIQIESQSKYWHISSLLTSHPISLEILGSNNAKEKYIMREKHADRIAVIEKRLPEISFEQNKIPSPTYSPPQKINIFLPENKVVALPESKRSDFSNYVLHKEINQNKSPQIASSFKDLIHEHNCLMSFLSTKTEENLLMEQIDFINIIPSNKIFKTSYPTQKVVNLYYLLTYKIKENLLKSLERLKRSVLRNKFFTQFVLNLVVSRSSTLTIPPSRKIIDKHKFLLRISSLIHLEDKKRKLILKSKLQEWWKKVKLLMSFKEYNEKNMKEIRNEGLYIKADMSQLNKIKGIFLIRHIQLRENMKKIIILKNKIEKWSEIIRLQSTKTIKQKVLNKGLEEKFKLYKAISIINKITYIKTFKYFLQANNKKLFNWIFKTKKTDYIGKHVETLSISKNHKLEREKRSNMLLNKIISLLRHKNSYILLKNRLEMWKHLNYSMKSIEKVQEIKISNALKFKAYNKIGENIIIMNNKRIIKQLKKNFELWRKKAIEIKRSENLLEKMRKENFISILIKKIKSNELCPFYKTLKDNCYLRKRFGKVSKFRELIIKRNNKNNGSLLNQSFQKMLKFNIFLEKEKRKEDFIKLVNALNNTNCLKVLSKNLCSHHINFFKRLNKVKEISKGMFLLEDITTKKAKTYFIVFIDALFTFNELSLQSELLKIKQSNKLEEISYKYIFLVIPFFINLLGYLLIASMEAFREGFSFIPNCSPYLNCFLISVLAFILLIKFNFYKNKKKKEKENNLENKLELIRDRKKTNCLKNNFQQNKEIKVKKIERTEEVNLETNTTYIPTDENQAQKCSVILDDEVYDEVTNSKENIQSNLEGNISKKDNKNTID